ncbi:MAG: DUF72 domain-containing protein [Limnochordaceae bacterium]|nr:DUF72 domain-containing protein [Limnochordaceae bacterium]
MAQTTGPVQPATALGQPGRLWLGTSGFNYPHWRGRFYPADLPPSRWLAFYARHFAAVELNVTFYRLPTAEAFSRWAESVPESFRFVLKGSLFITHIKHLSGCEDPLGQLLERASRLGGRLEAIVWQLPPRFSVNVGRLEAFLELLRRHPLAGRVRHAFEFRDESWFEALVMQLLAQHNAAVVMADWPFRDRKVEPTANWVYIRRHGPGAPYADSYPERMLAADARAIREWLQAGRDVFCFFNNDVGGHAAYDALRLRELVAAHRQ